MVSRKKKVAVCQNKSSDCKCCSGGHEKLLKDLTNSTSKDIEEAAKRTKDEPKELVASHEYQKLLHDICNTIIKFRKLKRKLMPDDK